MSQQISSFSIGSFILHIDSIGDFVVINFQLTKSVGKINTCTAIISDYTQQVVVNNQGNGFPRTLGSVKNLFQETTKIQNTGKLYSCKLIQYKTKDASKVWFYGKVCVITPTLNTAYGVKAGMQCYCMGQACQLMFKPFSDFVYVPGGFVSNQEFLQRVGVFKPGGITQALFAASKRPDVKTIINKGKIQNTSTILYIINSALDVLMKWNKISPQTKELASEQSVDLNKYFTGDIKLSENLLKQASTVHPYIQELIKYFANGFQGSTILDAIVGTLGSQDRYLTFAPSSMSSGEDLLHIIPAYIRKADLSFHLLNPENMLGCSISANPLQHIKTPTYIYVRGKKKSAWQSQKDNVTDYDKTVGSYCLKGATQPYRLQILDVPAWMLNTVVQVQQKQEGNKSSPLTSQSAYDKDKQEQKKDRTSLSRGMMDAFAKTVFFNRYMLNKAADITLAINEDMINIDEFIGDSLFFYIPIQAADLGSEQSTQAFYGVLQSVTYFFQAASTPTAKSNLGIRCSLSGIMKVGDQGAQDLYNGQEKNFIYEG